MKQPLAFLNVILAMTILAWPLALYGSIFMFDAPGSTSNPITVSLAIAVLCYPVPTIIGNVGFWFFNKNASPRRMLVYTFLSLLGPAVVLLLVVALAVFCGGKFACR